ncbi:unnamed protein product [Pleuronectes platessa]|uniref:Uncharacterized protein n=1 Tax=Pleuronectes platessa TaxID=8262 RepID=A0A9N7YQ94_PLEPL|nr:unnamed protein product [Pleuronectes platessa]
MTWHPARGQAAVHMHVLHLLFGPESGEGVVLLEGDVFLTPVDHQKDEDVQAIVRRLFGSGDVWFLVNHNSVHGLSKPSLCGPGEFPLLEPEAEWRRRASIHQTEADESLGFCSRVVGQEGGQSPGLRSYDRVRQSDENK